MEKTSLSRLLLILLFGTLLSVSCSDDEMESATEEMNEEQDGSAEVLTTASGIEFVRTPDSQFDNLPNWPYEYQYVEIDGLRQAYAEAGPSDGEVVLLLHGQPSWSYLYRDMIPVLADAGYRVIAMDHLGFGRSDKPVDITSYSYLGHYDRIVRFIELLNLTDINLFGQDWGAVIGLRVVGMNPELFKSVTIGNGFLPNVAEGETIYPAVENPNEIEDIPSIFTRYTPQQVPYFDNCVRLIEEFDFAEWMVYTMKSSQFKASEVLEGWTWLDLTPEIEAAYDAPFPSREYMAGARVFPSLLNETPGVTMDAWMGLATFQKPFLTLWGANDPLDLGDCELQQTLIDIVPGAAGQAHHRFPDASHFLQSDKGVEIANRLIDFYTQEIAPTEEASVQFEIFQIVSETEIIAWANTDGITLEEFNALELPEGWTKNQPREVLWDDGEFSNSPGQEPGVFVNEELFGFQWQHVATVGEREYSLDPDAILVGSDVFKNHTVYFNAGSIVQLVVSPEGDTYLFATRDANRTTDVATLPEGWQRSEFVPETAIQIQLPNPTINIRADNQDSFQGPLTEEDFQPRQ